MILLAVIGAPSRDNGLQPLRCCGGGDRQGLAESGIALARNKREDNDETKSTSVRSVSGRFARRSRVRPAGVAGGVELDQGKPRRSSTLHPALFGVGNVASAGAALGRTDASH